MDMSDELFFLGPDSENGLKTKTKRYFYTSEHLGKNANLSIYNSFMSNINNEID